VFENTALRRISGPKRDEVTEEWRKLHSVELHNLYSSPDIRQIKSRRMWWASHVARMEETCTGFCSESPKEKDHLEGQGVDGCDQTGSWGDWLRGYGVDSPGLG
jgi:hypothetical protein